MTKTLSRRALLRSAPAVPVAAIAAPVAASEPALPEWQAYICDITTNVNAQQRNFLRVAAEVVADQHKNPPPFQPGPIEELLIEFRRRNEIICADGFGEI